ncbi:doubled motif LPXTG anchor domain-containing protein [Negativibacillus massiliensis]|uniref:doubled motif LPXTG anchor domain-containing protein n=1 Tax=Negativibacillus massiliensis TaxID=1871035 RepID=UPI002A8213B5|nr:doubled motif LPXTG anchor domain-containing protein [Negativibacillus massiliensis]MDY4047377.1 doubled motif LPXTG anchor domain-containing protein [Negativibacillus massiliensis]
MKNKFMRSVTAMVVAVTMLISSQGVVTSFADGGDHSDMSESSSVQMNEVGNNGTDQSTKDDAAQCNCGATDGEAHKEGCPLYVKPDGGNTNDGDIEDDAAQCTCGAKEGEPHQENCPLYVKPDDGNTNNGDTDNSAGEDADIKSVVDDINALPAAETITEETDLVSLKDQVNAARVAYDALSDDQKAAFDAATLEKLTALEAKISELESGEQETAPSEAVQNVIEKIDAAVEQIDYTTETITATDGTTVTKTHITMLKDLDPANNAELKALIDKEAAHEQDENQPALTNEEAAQLDAARKAFEDASAKYRSEGFSDAQLAARQAYDALATEEEKAQVTNYSLLEAMEENIAYIMQAVNTLPNGETVAMIGDTEYKTLDEAIAAAGDGATIEVLQDCTSSGINLTKDLTIEGQKNSNGLYPIIKFTDKGIALWGKSLTFKTCNIIMQGVGSTPYAEWSWMTICANKDASLNLINSFMLLDANGVSNSPHAIYFCSNNKLNLTESTLEIKNYPQDALEWDGGDGGYNVNLTKSIYISDNNRSGFTGTFVVTVSDQSRVQVLNSRGNGSNGSHFIVENKSIVDFSNNGSHGLSAGNLTIKDSTVTATDNKFCGIVVSGKFNISDHSIVTVDSNASGKSEAAYAGFRLSGSGESTIDSTSSLSIKNNQNTGLYVRAGDLTISEGANVEITNNTVTNNIMGGFGGGIYVGYEDYSDSKVILPSNAKIYNNHAPVAGDDIYIAPKASITFSGVGSDWILDDTNLPITGWYFDGDNNGTTTNRWSKSNYYELFNLFDESGKATLTGTYALKAAHAYAYDPETPVNPTDWEHSKSKTATNLDANYQSQVTLSLPAAQEQLVSDVVFVLDKSTSATVEDQMIEMLNSLNQQITETGAKVKVGVVIFNKEANRVLELTELNSDNMGKIQEAIKKDISSGTNTHAGLLAGKAMLEADTSVDANRKYMILVSDGMTYMFDEPAQAINSIQATNGENAVMAGTDCWGIRHYLEGKDSFIPEDWTSYLQDVGSKLTEIEQYIQPYDNRDNTNYISKGNTELPTTVDVALYKTQEVFKQMQNNGYHCYSVLAQTNITNYPWGPSFMNYLAGGKEVSFDDIQNDIYYLLDAGSQVVDVIGEGIDNLGNEYDFKFINNIDNLNLTVGGTVLNKKQIDENTYGFGNVRDGIYDFVLTYYPEGMGTRSMEVAGELFRWDINVPVSNFAPVQLTYTVQLTNPQTADGTYGQYDADGSEEYAGLYTNKMAILYPVDSNGVEGEQEAFQKPTVSYSISNGKPVDPPVDPEDPTPRPGGGGDEDDDTPTIINETPVPTTTIDDEDVPLTDLPEDTVTIDDEEVPLKDIPNTGDMIPVPAMVAAVISIGGIALLMKKHK